MEQFVDMHHLLRGIGRSGLLSVTEGGIGNEDIFGHIFRDTPIIECDLRRFRVGEHFPEQLGLLYVLQPVDIGILFKFKGLVA